MTPIKPLSEFTLLELEEAKKSLRSLFKHTTAFISLVNELPLEYPLLMDWNEIDKDHSSKSLIEFSESCLEEFKSNYADVVEEIGKREL